MDQRVYLEFLHHILLLSKRLTSVRFPSPLMFLLLNGIFLHPQTVMWEERGFVRGAGYDPAVGMLSTHSAQSLIRE